MIDVVIPVLDEASALPWLLSHWPEGFRPLVVDNGSTDDSVAIASAHGARVIDEPVRGFGSACYAGLRAANTEIVCFMDGDASLDPRDLAHVVAPIAAGTADLVLGARVAAPGAWPLHARIANGALTLVLRHRGLRLRDLGPMRAARRRALLDLGIEDRRSGWPLEMVLRAAAAGWVLAEVDVPYRPRAGRSKVTGTVRGTFGATRDMSRVMRALR